MSDDVLERIGVAVAQTGIQMSPEAVRVAARVLLDWLGTFHGIPASELLQARREFGLTSTAAAEPAKEEA